MEERVEERTGDAAAPLAAAWSTDDDWSAADRDAWVDEASTGGVADGATYGDAYEGDADPGYGGDGYGPDDDGGAYGPPPGGRNMPAAIGVGVGLAGLGVIALSLGGAATTALVTVILALCAIEYFEVLRKVGWESARLVGLVAASRSRWPSTGRGRWPTR
jgi:hypothetical protein